MSQPTADSVRHDPARAGRLLGNLSLGPGERVLCLGPGSGAAARLAAIRVGPAGQVSEAGDDAAAAGGVLPYADGEFDAVVVDLAAPPAAQARLLAEVARVTAPTGRIAIAVMPAGEEDPARVRRIAADAGLRGVAIRPDQGDGSGAEPALFVTAFPPRPAESGAETTAAMPLPEPTGRPHQRPRRPGRLVAAGAAGLVLAAAAGVGWGLAGADPGTDLPGVGSGLRAGDAGPGREQPDPGGQPGDGEPAGGDGLPGDGSGSGSGAGAGSGSGSGSGSGPGSSGGDSPGNRSPVIDDLGLSSDGLTLRIVPSVSDPDGDDVSLAFEVDGERPLVSEDGTTAVAAFSYDQVGAEHEASVTVTATDGGGASSNRTASHRLTAKTTVTVRNVTFRILNPGSCFDAGAAHRLAGRLTLGGAVGGSRRFSEELRRDRPQVVLLDSSSGTEPVAAEQRLALEFSFDGRSDTYQAVHRAGDQVARHITSRASDCRGWLFYEVAFERS